MGDFRDFNLAMLGKQGWRFIKNPHSLVSEVFKARYFPDCSFMDAQIGNNLSFVWRSIWEAKHVIAAGMRWRIGSGNSVNIVGQPWLLGETNPFITTPVQGLQNHKVSALMATDHRGWDEDTLSDMFNIRDQQCIKRINLTESSEEEEIYWGKEVSGHYSVRSTYRLLQQQKNLWRQGGSEQYVEKDMEGESTSKGFKLHVESFIKMFANNDDVTAETCPC
ncbi:hypothetical protein ACET3Z_024259 [Daucus carota]